MCIMKFKVAIDKVQNQGKKKCFLSFYDWQNDIVYSLTRASWDPVNFKICYSFSIFLYDNAEASFCNTINVMFITKDKIWYSYIL